MSIAVTEKFKKTKVRVLDTKIVHLNQSVATFFL
jgi:hypothetical protein